MRYKDAKRKGNEPSARPLREYFCSYDNERGLKVRAASAEASVRLFLSLLKREPDDHSVRVACGEAVYSYILQGIPSPARRQFTEYAIKAADSREPVYYIFKWSRCRKERVYGCTSRLVRGLPRSAVLQCSNCTPKRSQTLRYTVHTFVEAASEQTAELVDSIANKKWGHDKNV